MFVALKVEMLATCDETSPRIAMQAEPKTNVLSQLQIFVGSNPINDTTLQTYLVTDCPWVMHFLLSCSVCNWN